MAHTRQEHPIVRPSATRSIIPLTALAVGLGGPIASTPSLRAQEAESADSVTASAILPLPLFEDDAVLKVTLRTEIDRLRKERSTEEEVDGEITYTDQDGNIVTLPIKVRARGNFRRDAANCNFPPLRLNLPTGRVEGTVFHGQDKLKLVTPCNDRRGTYQEYVLQEYLLYRTLAIMTPYSYRVRLLEITYEDTAEEYDTRTLHAFLIESGDELARRTGGRMMEIPQLHPALTDDGESTFVALFAYMIGNTDWSPAFFHNVDLLQLPEGRYVTVPYDFDFAGAVNARYASPDPSLGIRSVRERVFRGFCRATLEEPASKARFLEARDSVRGLYDGFPLLDEGDRKRTLDYFEDFYQTLGDARRYDSRIVERCRRMPD